MGVQMTNNRPRKLSLLSSDLCRIRFKKQLAERMVEGGFFSLLLRLSAPFVSKRSASMRLILIRASPYLSSFFLLEIP